VMRWSHLDWRPQPLHHPSRIGPRARRLRRQLSRPAPTRPPVPRPARPTAQDKGATSPPTHSASAAPPAAPASTPVTAAPFRSATQALRQERSPARASADVRFAPGSSHIAPAHTSLDKTAACTLSGAANRLKPWPTHCKRRSNSSITSNTR
jgi:hypothetical protein